MDCILRVLTPAVHRGFAAPIAGITAAILTFAVAPSALALHVGATPNVIPDTSRNPASCTVQNPCSGNVWSQGDPGWANSAHMGAVNAVYIGDGWMLGAAHTGIYSSIFDNDPHSYDMVPNQFFYVPSPGNIPGLTANADLIMFRLRDDPGLPSMTIAHAPLALNDEVVTVGTGLTRASADSYWIDGGEPDHIWTKQTGSCSGQNCYHGYETVGAAKVWGTNRVANDTVLNGLYGDEVNDGDIIIKHDSQGIWTTVTNITTYDQGSGNPFESQLVGGDSGSPVFHKRGSQWELAGISLGIYTYPGQPGLTSVYNDVSAFADLSAYYDQIAQIKTDHVDYSLVGDLNLNGIGPQNDPADIAAFVAAWGYNNGLNQGTLTSWKNGDLTHDGKTDVNDFFRLRSALSSGAAAELAAALGLSVGGGGATSVPEPATFLMAVGPTVFFALYGRKRRPRRTV